MTLRPCSHESEIKQLLQRGYWPQACTPELRAHVESCRACGDLVLVTEAFQSARAASASVPSLPPPGVLWWRAQLRRRNAAVERINKPILGAQIFAFAITLLIAAGVVISQANHGLHWLLRLGAGPGNTPGNGLLDWLATLLQSPTFHLKVLWPLASAKPDMSLTYLVPGVVMLAFLSGVVLYLASEKQ
jgi:hypothetical protein